MLYRECSLCERLCAESLKCFISINNQEKESAVSILTILPMRKLWVSEFVKFVRFIKLMIDKTKTQILTAPKIIYHIPYEVVHTSYFSPGNVKTGRSGIQSHSWLCSKLEESLSFRRPCLKQYQRNKVPI